MGEVWVPGAAGPQDVFVARIVARIEAFVERYGKQAHVEVELRGGPTAVLRSLDPDPGAGFITLIPHNEDGGEEEWIIPVAAIARITLSFEEEEAPFGFSLPSA